MKYNTAVCCSFCGKNKSTVQKIIASNNAFICNECVNICHNALIKESKLHKGKSLESIPKPKEIYNSLNEYVIGQSKAKKILSVAVYNHYKRILDNSSSDIEIIKSNVMLIGSTGCGKTLLAQTLAKIFNLPFAIADATSLTESGYVGDDVESILLKLLQASNFDINRAQTGIVYIDEIDKIAKKSSSSSSGRDISGEGVQQNLLKLIEGTIANVPQNNNRKIPHQDCIKLDTTNILFIAGGAFDGLDSIIKTRTDSQSFGFGAKILSENTMTAGELFEKVETEDLIKFGLIPEFLGRFPVISTLHDITEEELKRILIEPKNSIYKQYKRLFAIDNIDFDIHNDALSLITKKAIERKTGARGLRNIMEELLLNAMFDLSDDVKKVVINTEKNEIVINTYDLNHNLITT